ncbi:MAG: Na(+)-translocating NADH-quinone reductase subunit A [Bacteroidales bacterium]|jgi:Na+-transporting NADH:ubiquinone oxidoreductase subunit A|nr:Na(+)-translocating NADH-quinone reductase subunit A [Bacteroidales bacterium]
MSNKILLRKGLNIPLKGSASNQIARSISPDILAVKPTDFKGLNPKLLVKEGDLVKAGTPVIADKKNPEILICSPASGTVKEIVRGEKRKLLQILIQADKKQEYEHSGAHEICKTGKPQELKDTLLASGLWVLIKQRPYGTIADPSKEPKAIFISGFDSAPLAADMDYAMKNEFDNMQMGVNILSKLSKGGVHIGLHADTFAGSPMHRLEKAKIHVFDGPHPAGNVGIQIHHISPINKGETVWTLDLYALAAIGRLFNKGVFDLRRVIAVAGPKAKKPAYVETLPGMAIKEISDFADSANEVRYGDEVGVRYISGNVLTGENAGIDGYTGMFHNVITIMAEGNYREMFGWIKPLRSKKFSISRSYFSWLMPNKQYNLDTNLNGGERAFVVTGVYEKVLPMDILPLYLFKAILADDIDKMEQLGIYEVIEEDVALCEFVCPSKAEIQDIVSKGINTMIKEMS